MSPARIDRAELVARLGDAVPRWVIDELIDAYEPALLESRHLAGKVRQARSSGAPDQKH